MKRRAFLGFLGGAAVAGPSAAKSVAEMSLSDLSLRLAGMGVLSGAPEGGGCVDGAINNRSYAKEALARMMGKTAHQRAKDISGQYVDGLDPEIAGLRSVALHTKVRMTRVSNYERSEKRALSYWEGVLAGWWE